MVGTTISHYKVLEKIGQGGMGEVHLAEDSRLDTSFHFEVHYIRGQKKMELRVGWAGLP